MWESLNEISICGRYCFPYLHCVFCNRPDRHAVNSFCMKHRGSDLKQCRWQLGSIWLQSLCAILTDSGNRFCSGLFRLPLLRRQTYWRSWEDQRRTFGIFIFQRYWHNRKQLASWICFNITPHLLFSFPLISICRTEEMNGGALHSTCPGSHHENDLHAHLYLQKLTDLHQNIGREIVTLYLGAREEGSQACRGAEQQLRLRRLQTRRPPTSSPPRCPHLSQPQMPGAWPEWYFWGFRLMHKHANNQEMAELQLHLIEYPCIHPEQFQTLYIEESWLYNGGTKESSSCLQCHSKRSAVLD